jgi:hypothetical protein
MTVPELKHECTRHNILFSSSVSKPILQEKLRLHFEQLSRAIERENTLHVQQPQRDQMKDEAIDDQEGVICTICYEEYSDLPTRTPRLLPCGHTFCTDCVKSFIGRKAPNTIACPTCNHNLQLVAQVANSVTCPVATVVPVNFYAKDVSTLMIFISVAKYDVCCRFALV